MGGSGGSCLWGRLERVIFVLGQSRQTPCGSEEDGSGGLDIGRRGRMGCPHIRERAEQNLLVELGEGRLNLYGGGQKNREDRSRQKSILGPRRGPRGGTTMAGRHSTM